MFVRVWKDKQYQLIFLLFSGDEEDFLCHVIAEFRSEKNSFSGL